MASVREESSRLAIPIAHPPAPQLPAVVPPLPEERVVPTIKAILVEKFRSWMLGPKDPFEKAKWRLSKSFRWLVLLLGGAKIASSFLSNLQLLSVQTPEFTAKFLFNASSDAVIFGVALVAAWMFALWCNVSYQRHINRQ